MTQLSVAIEVNLPGLERFQKQIRAQIDSGASGPIDKCFNQWAVRYRAFVQRRFNTYARGGGNWPPLSPATIRRRRKPAKRTKAKRVRITKKGEVDKRFKKRVQPEPVAGRQVAILRDTGSLFNALAPSISPPVGSVNNRIAGGIEVGYGGNAQHGADGVTIAELAFWHQTGAGHLPVREIIVEPDAATVAGMVLDMQRAVDEQSESS